MSDLQRLWDRDLSPAVEQVLSNSKEILGTGNTIVPKCEHGRGINDFCALCGRIHSG